jgi:maltose alpha-D-glucosyltransferase/alpha-amylase
MTDDGYWYKDAVFYELHVRSFMDGNNDGVGDFLGLTSKLDYLHKLGIDCIWLLPFYESPLRDDGYDIADYRRVHPSYGTMEDVEVFLREAHARGIRVIADLVVNHTSDQHAWFQRAVASPPGSPERDYYVWSDTDQKYLDARIIFVDTERSNWTWHPQAQAYYWHRFYGHQPDLNYESPRVQQEMLDVMRFWLDRGLDGFRCDAVPYLFQREGTNCENLPETHAFLKELRAALDREYTGKILLAEANQWPTDVRPYFGDGDEFHMAFHFPLMPRLFMALRRQDRTPIVEILARTPPIPETCQWGTFLRNHDELTLEMVTDEERDYMYFEYAKDPKMRLNLGIRRRLAPLLDNHRGRIELLNALLISLPGSPVIYYGDEIGMGDNYFLGDRDGVRTPMQWSPDRNAGFSRCDYNRLTTQLIQDPVYGYMSINVEAQERHGTSLLNWMRRLIQLRKRFPVFGRGSIEFLGCENKAVFAFIRKTATQTMLCVNNLSEHVQPIELDLRDYEGSVPIEVTGNRRFPPIRSTPYFLSLGGYDFFWFLVEGRPEVPPSGAIT